MMRRSSEAEALGADLGPTALDALQGPGSQRRGSSFPAGKETEGEISPPFLLS